MSRSTNCPRHGRCPGHIPCNCHHFDNVDLNVQKKKTGGCTGQDS